MPSNTVRAILGAIVLLVTLDSAWAQGYPPAATSPPLAAPLGSSPSLFIEANRYSWDQWQYGPRARKRELSIAEKKMRRLSATLARPVEHVKFENKRLGDILDSFFAAEHGLTIDVFWDALAKQRVTPDTPVSLELSETTVEEILDAVVGTLREQLDTKEFSYYVLDATVKLSTEEEFDKLILTRVYDITWLGTGVPHFVDAPQITLDWRRSYMRYEPWEQDYELPPLAGVTLDPERNFRELRDQLIDVLTDLRPTSWEAHGGPGSITIFGTKLVIHQTPEMHILIGGKWW